jgi:hypothetical protein
VDIPNISKYNMTSLGYNIGFQALSNLDAHPTRSLGGTDLLNFQITNVCGTEYDRRGWDSPRMVGEKPSPPCGIEASRIGTQPSNTEMQSYSKHEAGTGACLHQNFQQDQQGFATKLGDLPAKTWPKMGHTDLQQRECKHKHHILARKVDFLSPWGFHQKLGLSNGDLNHQNAKHKDAV